MAFFFLSVALQKTMPLSSTFLQTAAAATAGWILLAAGILVLPPAIWKFLISKNTLVTIKPAQSLQTTGIYAITRNPMYIGLLLLYRGIGILKGDCWTFIVIPLLIIVVQVYIISKEERYLQRAFGNAYCSTKRK